jgi:DNA-binding response OmpR family regulator
MTEAELLDENERLREEVAYWRSEAEIQADDSTRAALLRQLRLTPQEAWLLAALYRARSKSRVRVTSLEEAIPRVNGGERDGHSISVYVCRLRRKLGGSIIDTVRGMYGQVDGGYRISPAGIALCQAALD